MALCIANGDRVNMRQTGYLNFFDILTSGIYKFGDDLTPLGIETSQAFDGIKAWVDTQIFENTSPWSPLAKDKFSPAPVRCYCKELYKTAAGDFVIVLWKHDPSDVGGYMGLELNASGSPCGVLKNNSSDKKNVIWGHPCYYWVIPEVNALVSIKFDDSTCDTQLFHKWVLSCIRNKAEFPGFKTKEAVDEKYIVKFTLPGSENKHFTYKFDAKTIQIKTDVEKLRNVSKDTTSIILRESVSTNSLPLLGGEESDEARNEVDSGSATLMRLFGKLFSSRKIADSNVRKFEMSVEANPTYEQILDIVNDTSHHQEDDWSDVIFVNSKKEKVSLKSYRINEHVSMNKVDYVYTAKELESTLTAKRAHILNMLAKARVALPVVEEKNVLRGTHQEEQHEVTA